ANTVEVVNNVRRAVERLNRNFPGGLKLSWVHDDGEYIQSSVDGTVGNIWQGVLLTAAILFFFLYNVRSTFVVAVSMPLTIVVSLFFLQLLGYTLNGSTLLAIGLSVGILVSNSLVVLESILTHFHRTGDPWRAARDGSAEVGTAVVASAGTNIVVLLPIGLMGSMVGLFFRPFAFTSLLVNVASIFISFTLTPILCALLLKATPNDQALLLRMERWWNDKLRRIAHGYVAFLRKLMRHRWVALGMLGGVGLLFFHALTLGSAVGFSFAPDLDRGTVYVKLECPTRLDLDATTRRTAEAEALLKDLPGLIHIFTSIGKVDARIGSAGEGVYLAQLLVKFVDKSERTQTADELVDEMRRRLATLPDTIATVSMPGLVGGQSSPVEVEIRGEDIGELNRLALQFQDMVKEIPGFVDPDTTVRVGKPELRVLPQRAILADMNMAPQDLGLLLRANLEGLKAGTYKSGASTFDIRVKLAEEPGKAQVSEFQLPAGQGSPVIMSNFTSIQEQEAPVQITRTDKQRVSKLMADLGPELPLGTAVDLLSRRIDGAAIMPPGYDYRFRGDYEIMSEAGAAFAEAGIMAVLLTYLALSAILESFTWSLLILTTVPLGLVGVLWALYFTGTSISIFVLLGVVMLVGIVVNNAILVVDRMRLLRNEGVDPVEAMYQALDDSFRAVVMVTLAAVLGMLPLAVASGLGSELNNGIGIASAGGIAMSSLLALFVVPLIFLVGKSFRRKKELPQA
ncbi:MAG TPA: efflux RND transporter permease subunit, partial [Synergistaceae bacterium]|nr:efflux RND transporter permease subunit [Synergistaceae bacterium]